MGQSQRGVTMATRQTFSTQFKREAVRLLEQGEKPATEIALDLGIRRNQLYKWRRALLRNTTLRSLCRLT